METLDVDVDRLSAMMKALGHPVRLQMIRSFVDCGDRACIDLTREVDLAQSTVSEHLRVLKDAGLIEQCGPGARSGYCLRKDSMLWLKQAVVAL